MQNLEGRREFVWSTSGFWKHTWDRDGKSDGVEILHTETTGGVFPWTGLTVFMSFALQINVQTDSTDAHPSPPPTKVLKNKALLCKPLVRNKGVSCKTQTADCGAQTGKSYTCLHPTVVLAALLTCKSNKQNKNHFYPRILFFLLLYPLWGHGGGWWSLALKLSWHLTLLPEQGLDRNGEGSWGFNQEPSPSQHSPLQPNIPHIIIFFTLV